MLSLTSSRITIRLAPRTVATVHRRCVGSVASITDADWENVVIKGSDSKVVLVDFTAKWCNPCQMLTPTLEKLAKQEDIVLAKYDIDESSEMAETHAVNSIPAVFAFVGGKPVSKFVGAQREADVLTFIREAKKQSIKE